MRLRLLLTLLFLGAVGLSRTWDLRGYTADGLALLDLPHASLWLSLHRSQIARSWPPPMVQSASMMPWRAGPRISGMPQQKKWEKPIIIYTR